jgi:uncharacterized membrane protein YdfJ with MMPL/SSD domain
VLTLGAGVGGLGVYELHSDWFRQFKNETDGTRGYEALKTVFPAGALAPTTVLLERSDGSLQSGDARLVQSRLRGSPGVAAVSDVLRRSGDGRWRYAISLLDVGGTTREEHG